jgi:hypothetical protein
MSHLDVKKNLDDRKFRLCIAYLKKHGYTDTDVRYGMRWIEQYYRIMRDKTDGESAR